MKGQTRNKRNRRQIHDGIVSNINWVLAGVFIILLIFLEKIIGTLPPNFQIIKSIFVIIFSIFIIMKAAGYWIAAVTDFAKHTGLSHYLIGFLIVSIGTSLPELSTAVFASLKNVGAIALGDVIGANIINLTLVLGLAILFMKKMKVEENTVGKSVVFALVVAIIPLFLAFDGRLSKIDGIILLIAFLAFICHVLKKEKGFGKIKKQVAFKHVWKNTLVFGGCLAAVLLSARWLVVGVMGVAKSPVAQGLDINVFIIGIVVVAIGTTVPELVVGIKSALHGIRELAFGNAIGSVVTNSCLVLGIAAFIRPITFDIRLFYVGALFMIASLVITTLFMKQKKLSRKHGFILCTIYVVFLVLSIVMR